MANGVNKCILLGTVGADPEMRGSALKIRLATNESYFDKKKNERVEKTEWHTATVFGPRAEALQKIVTKGMQLYVEGSLHTSSYEKNGVKQWSTEVIANEVILCGGKKGEGAPRAQQDSRTSAPLGPDDMDSLPF